MPTPVGTPRQFLTPEAARALDEAVAVARGRGHAQTTSLHLVSSLLSLPSSALREACSHLSRNCYSTRVQMKALELCLGVSLDRLASTRERVPESEEPPVSNSLMAAIKRSQANQRRHPENFSFYQQQMQCASSSTSMSIVKVELQNLILSVLDDPVVSRVFGEAGFRSCDIKLAILRPVHQLFKYSRYKSPAPPLFLCNMNPGGDNLVKNRNFSFPFLGFSGVLEREENCRRIGQVMAKKHGGKNPLLLGIYANDTLKSFLEMVGNKDLGDILPLDLSKLKLICVEKEISRFVKGEIDERLVKSRLDEVRRMVGNCEGGCGVVVNFGDLKGLASDDSLVAGLSCVVHELGRLVNGGGGKVWLIGSAARHETYFKVLNMYPSIEKLWDLHVLPITSVGPPSVVEQSSSRSSLMESFVPLGGFFPMPSEVTIPYSSSRQNVSHSHLCHDNREKEMTRLPEGGLEDSVMGRYQSILPWCTGKSSSESAQAKDDGMSLSTRIVGQQMKCDSSSQHHDSNHLFSKRSTDKLSCQEEDMLFKSDGINSPFTNDGKHSNPENDHGISKSSPSPSSSSASPTSATSVTTDLGLGMNSAFTSKEVENQKDQTCSDPFQADSVCLSANGDTTSGSNSDHTAHSSSRSLADTGRQVDVKDYKMLYLALADRVGHQEAAINTISQRIARHKSRSGKEASHRGIWFNLHGDDTVGKKKLAVALSEILYGSRENLTFVDLSFSDSLIHVNAVLGLHVLNKYEVAFRGKTVVDYIAEKLSKRPLSVVFIENIDKADVQVQNNLLQSLKTGRFSDSHGREVGISNATFVTTSGSVQVEKALSSVIQTNDYSEEDILAAKGWPIQMVIGFDLGDDAMNGNLEEKACPDLLTNRRKRHETIESPDQFASPEVAKRARKESNPYLDLNSVPGEEGAFGTDSVLDNSDNWMESFLPQIDESLVFMQYDFDGLAEEISMQFRDCFNETVLTDCSLEIDRSVMAQVLAATYFTSSKRLEDWVHRVLRRGFAEAQEKYSLSDRSVVKLVTCQGTDLQDQTPPDLLPARILLH